MRTIVDLGHIKPLDHKTSMQLAAKENQLLLRLLRDLDEGDWDAPTECDLWSVRDIVAHLIGWAECLASPKEAAHQLRAAIGKKKEFDAFTHAQNQVQVEDRRSLSPAELMASYESSSARMLRVRRSLGIPGRAIPLYVPFIGGFMTLNYLLATIFTRDTFMHRIDISRATDRPLEMGLHQDVLIADIVRDWAQRVDMPVRVELDGPAGGVFSHDDPRVVVRTNPRDFCRFMAGRAGRDELEVEGEEADVDAALALKAPF